MKRRTLIKNILIGILVNSCVYANSETKNTKEVNKIKENKIITTPTNKPTEAKKTEEMKQNISILALGDSYTIGESVPYNDRWVIQLSELLKKENFLVEEPKIIARTGWTTSELMEAIKLEKSKLKSSYDFVYLLIGVNNQYRNLSIDIYKKEFQELLNTALGFTNNNKNRVIVISIPDWSYTPYAEGYDKDKISKEIDLYNSINLQETKNMSIQYVDITDTSRKNQSDLFAEDGLHPSKKMYSEWAHRVFNLTIKEIKTN